MNSDVGALDRDRVTRLVHRFYDEIRRDPELQPIFASVVGDDWQPHLDRMVSFWSTVTLGEKTFRGNVFGKHMALEGVRPEHFLRWLTLWHRHTDALLEPMVAADMQAVAHGIARNLFYGLFGDFARFHVRDGAVVAWEPERV